MRSPPGPTRERRAGPTQARAGSAGQMAGPHAHADGHSGHHSPFWMILSGVLFVLLLYQVSSAFRGPRLAVGLVEPAVAGRRTAGGWQDGGRDQQAYSISYATQAAPGTFIPPPCVAVFVSNS